MSFFLIFADFFSCHLIVVVLFFVEMKIIANNKKAYFDYYISDVVEAGIVLVGSEVKSIRQGGISLNESYVSAENGEIFLRNAYIKPYEKSSAYTPNDKRVRKLLLSKTQILNFQKKSKVQGYAIVPLKIGLSRNFVKIEIGLGKGKKLHDKRDALKNESMKREIERATKSSDF